MSVELLSFRKVSLIMKIREFIPRPIKSTMLKIYYLPMDTIDLLLGRRDELTPPRRLIFLASGVSDPKIFSTIGEEFLRYFIELGELKPNEKVLDVGCGCGRMAVPLTKYLGGEGSYEGIDIVPDSINWCKENVTPKHPNFRFQLADIYSEFYNPKGKYEVSNYRFPYENDSFDFIFLSSVLTHLLPQGTENYFSEIARVLKRNGRCLISFFLLNSESLKVSHAEFGHDWGVYHTKSKRVPERGVAYDERFIRGLYEKYGMNIMEPIHYGSWCGRESSLSYQDIIIAVKE
jgi:ubiquinone/menaquinone biosynthesis C-methylase UbiE